MKIIRLFLLSLFVYSIMACSPSVFQGINIGALDLPITKDSIWDHTNVTFLEEDSVNILGDVSSIKYDKGVYAILNDKNNIISLFDKKGKCLSSLNRVGKAHDEYIYIHDFDISNDSLYVLCTPNKVIVTDMMCKVKSIIDIKEGFSRLAKNNGYLYAYRQNDRSVHMYENNQWKEIINEGELPACPHVGNPVFFKVNNELFYCSEGGDCFYRIRNKSAEQLFVLNYPKKEKIMERAAKKQLLRDKERFMLSLPQIYSVIPNENSYVIIYSFQGVFRVCEVDAADFTLVKDGYWFGRTPLALHGSSIGGLCSYFITKDDCPLDTSRTKVTFTNKEKIGTGRLSLIMYCNSKE